MSRSTPSSVTPLATALLLSLVATGCGLCERVDNKKSAERSAADLAGLLPKDVEVAVFAATWRDVRDTSNLLDRKLGQQIPIKAGLAELNSAWGLDFNDLPGLQQKGVAADRGLSVAVVDKAQVFLVPLEAGPGFSKHLAALGKQRYSAFEQPQTLQLNGPNGQKATMNYLVKAGDNAQQAPPLDDKNLVLAWIVRDSTALVFPGPAAHMENDAKAQDVLTRLAFVTEPESLAKAPAFETIKADLGKDHPIFGLVNAKIYLQEQATQLGQSPYAKDEAAFYQKLANEVTYAGVGIKADESAAHATVHVLLSPESAQRLVAASRSAASPADLIKSIDGRPTLALKLAFDPEGGLKELRTLLQPQQRDDLDRALRAAKPLIGVDFQQDLLPALDGNISAYLYSADLMALMALNQGDLGTFLLKSRAALTLGLRDRTRLLTALDSAQKTLPPGTIERVEESGVVVYTLREPGQAPAEPTPQPEENPGGLQLKLNTFDDKPADKPADQPADQPADKPADPTPPPAGEPVAHLIVGEKLALLASPRIDRKQAITLASLGGPGVEAPMSQDHARAILTAQHQTGLLVDVERFTSLLGPQALMAGQALGGFDLWTLSLEAAPTGAIARLRLGFKPEPAGGAQTPGSAAQPASANPAPKP